MHVSYIVFWVVYGIIFFFKQKTAYDVRISDGSSDVCSSDHPSDEDRVAPGGRGGERVDGIAHAGFMSINHAAMQVRGRRRDARSPANAAGAGCPYAVGSASKSAVIQRSEEHTSELQSLMRISYAVFCLKKKKIKTHSK